MINNKNGEINLNPCFGYAVDTNKFSTAHAHCAALLLQCPNVVRTRENNQNSNKMKRINELTTHQFEINHLLRRQCRQHLLRRLRSVVLVDRLLCHWLCQIQWNFGESSTSCEHGACTRCVMLLMMIKEQRRKIFFSMRISIFAPPLALSTLDFNFSRVHDTLILIKIAITNMNDWNLKSTHRIGLDVRLRK